MAVLSIIMCVYESWLGSFDVMMFGEKLEQVERQGGDGDGCHVELLRCCLTARGGGQ